MATYRLSGLTIFLILLAVLLVAYLLNFTWESFAGGCKKEGFTNNFSGHGVLVPGYSQDEKEVVRVYESDGKKLFFDPIGRNIIEPLDPSKLLITSRNNETEDIDYAQTDINVWEHEATGSWSTDSEKGTDYTVISGLPIDEAKDKFKEMLGNDQLLSVTMDADSKVVSAKTYNLSDILGLTDAGKTIMTESETRSLFISQSLPSKDGASSLFWRAYENDNYKVQEKSGNSTEYIYVAQGNAPSVALLHVPITGTSVTFIHVMDLNINKHIETWYFNGDHVERRDHLKTIRDTNAASDFSKINGENVNFEKTYDAEMSQIADGEFVVETVHLKNSESPAIKIVCRKKETIGYSSFRALITFDSNQKPLLGKIETSSGSDSEDSSYSNDDKSELEQKWDQLRELQASLYGPFSGGYPYFGQSQYGGSPYNDYLLKTEVVPPVCPSCPTCPKEGVCTNCGGNGGSGSSELKDSLIKEFGSGIDSFLRDGADGATNIARDAAKGTYDVAKEATTGTVQLAKDTVSGAGGYAKDAASGVGEYTKDAASGAYSAASDVAAGTVGIGREIVGGVYDTGSNVASGVYNAGASVAGGAYNIGTGAVNALGRLNPTYGTASGGGAQAGGAYGGTAVPNSNMGGYQNSYAGGYQNPQVPATAGQDPYSYFGSIPSRNNMSNVMPVTADFSAFSK